MLPAKGNIIICQFSKMQSYLYYYYRCLKIASKNSALSVIMCFSRNSNFYAELRNCCVNSNNNNSHCFNLIQLADAFGPHICVLKTHIDVVSDFTAEISEKLKGLAQKYNFIIMEDR